MQGTASSDRDGREGAQTQGFRIAPLATRGVVRVTGLDAAQLLQGILTQDLGLLDRQAAIYTALLTPQGKILFDFFVVRSGDGLLLDVPRDKIGDLIKRLTLYRLRAKVMFAEAPDLSVLAVWGAGVPPSSTEDGIVFADPRLASMGWRALVQTARTAAWAAQIGGSTNEDDWHVHRVRLGVPEGGRDFTFGDAFPHEADMDQLAGVSFAKGCYVGQEVVARMQHRGTARKRIVQVVGQGALASGAAVTAGAANIGSVASVDGAHALALVRLDRAAEARAKGVVLTAGEIAIEIVKPTWATFDLAPNLSRERSDDL